MESIITIHIQKLISLRLKQTSDFYSSRSSQVELFQLSFVWFIASFCLRFVKSAWQQALRRTIEIYATSTQLALACNTSANIIDPTQNRCACVRLSLIIWSTYTKIISWWWFKQRIYGFYHLSFFLHVCILQFFQYDIQK